MKCLLGVVAVIAVSLAFSACSSGHSASGGSVKTLTLPPPGVTTDGHLPQPVLRRIMTEARKLTSGLGDSSVPTAAVYGPRSRLALVKASSGDWERTTARERNGFYLIVVRGRFVCRTCSVPARAGPPRGPIATDIWSPLEGGTDFGLSHRLPAAMSRLGSPTVIRLR